MDSFHAPVGFPGPNQQPPASGSRCPFYSICLISVFIACSILFSHCWFVVCFVFVLNIQCMPQFIILWVKFCSLVTTFLHDCLCPLCIIERDKKLVFLFIITIHPPIRDIYFHPFWEGNCPAGSEMMSVACPFDGTLAFQLFPFPKHLSLQTHPAKPQNSHRFSPFSFPSTPLP